MVTGTESVIGDEASILLLGEKLTDGPAELTVFPVIPSSSAVSEDARVSPVPTVTLTGMLRDPGGNEIPDPEREPDEMRIIWVDPALGS